jgi:hypothetical protein
MPRSYQKVLSLPLSAALLFLLISELLRIQQLQIGFEMSVVGLSALGILYLSRFAAKRSKTLKETTKLIMVLSWTFVTLFGMFHWNNLMFLALSALGAGSVWITIEVIDAVNKKSNSPSVNMVLGIGILLITFATYLKIQRMPFNTAFQLLGLLVSSIGFFVDYLKFRDENVVHNKT